MHQAVDTRGLFEDASFEQDVADAEGSDSLLALRVHAKQGAPKTVLQA